MKRLFTAGLACALSCQSILTAAQPGEFPASIESAIRAEALKAALEPTSSTDADWRALNHRLRAGALITITSSAIPPTRRIFVAVTDSAITVVNAHAPIPEAARASLLRLILVNPSGVADTVSGTSQQFETLELGNGWLSVRGARVAPLAEIIQTVQASDVREIHRSTRDAPSIYLAQPTLIGLGIGAAAAALVAAAGGCANGGCGAAVTQLILVPTGVGATVGVWEWSTHRQSHEDLVFHRP